MIWDSGQKVVYSCQKYSKTPESTLQTLVTQPPRSPSNGAWTKLITINFQRFLFHDPGLPGSSPLEGQRARITQRPKAVRTPARLPVPPSWRLSYQSRLSVPGLAVISFLVLNGPESLYVQGECERDPVVAEITGKAPDYKLVPACAPVSAGRKGKKVLGNERVADTGTYGRFAPGGQRAACHQTCDPRREAGVVRGWWWMAVWLPPFDLKTQDKLKLNLKR